MKYFVATAALAAFASATQQLEHMWSTSPIHTVEAICADDEPEWECIMRPLLQEMTDNVAKVEAEWTAEKREKLTNLNIKLEVAVKEHHTAHHKENVAKCTHEREVNMKELYHCELVALRTYTSSS
jgi:hypothetical protein